LTANGTIAPFPKHQFFTNGGDPAASYQLFTYVAGTSTKINTYTDVALSVANTNPIVLDSSGRCTIFLTPGTSVKFVFALPTDSDPPAAPIWTIDNVGAVPPTGTATDVDITGTAGENLSAGDAVFLSDGTGGNTAGRWYKTDADNTYSSSGAQAVGFATAAITTGSSGTIRRGGRITGLSGLTAGTLYFVSATAGAITAVAPTNVRAILIADSTTTGIILTGEPLASATVPGVVGLVSQTLGTGVSTDVKTVGGLVVNSQPTGRQGAATTGTMTIGGVIFADTGPRVNSGAGETDLSTTSLPANSLSANSKGIKVYAWGTCANSAGSKIIRLYFGGTSVLGTLCTLTAATASERWYVEYILQRRDATNQRALGHVQTDENGLAVVNRITTATPAETLSGAITIRSTGTAASGGASDIVQEGFCIEAIG
jgi:hypothetical protein